MPSRNIPPASGQLILGCRDIATFLGISPRQCLYLVETSQIPTFRLGGRRICAHRSVLEAFLSARAERALAETERLAAR
ncbi:hypothetical protein RSM1_24475 [Methylobacterium radiotolerans]|nr:hypothetical protein RSM1_24475 [Methylobacterium radiotolerans]